MSPQTAVKYDADVTDNGRVELAVPFPPGSHVLVYVMESADQGCADILHAAESSLDFWSNPIDDEDWNNA